MAEQPRSCDNPLTTRSEHPPHEFRYFIAQLRWEFPDASPDSVREAVDLARQDVGTEYIRILEVARKFLMSAYG